jgi:pyruvate dehydrogenase E2 component (dihydrolipoamide acetyltransferase)
VISKVTMPKWGMSMSEGKLVAWLVGEGAVLRVGDDLAEVETEKINGIVEASSAGILRRKVATLDDVIPVGGLLAVVAEAETTDAELDAFIDEARETFVAKQDDSGDLEPETVEVEGRRIRYLRRGEGSEVLLLLHGFGGNLENWLFNQDALAKGRTVYALDLPGHGGSTKDVGMGDLETFAGTVAGFLAALGHKRAHLVGHSLGGAIAITLAVTQPQIVASLTLVASVGLGPEIDREYIDGFIAASTRRDLEPHLERLFSDPNLVTRQLVTNVLRYKRLDGVDQALRKVAASAFSESGQRAALALQLADISSPVLVIWGKADQIIPSAHARRASPRARVEILEAGHSPHMEAASEVNRLIAEFVTEHASS